MKIFRRSMVEEFQRFLAKGNIGIYTYTARAMQVWLDNNEGEDPLEELALADIVAHIGLSIEGTVKNEFKDKK